jgi:hypothetical protein
MWAGVFVGKFHGNGKKNCCLFNYNMQLNSLTLNPKCRTWFNTQVYLLNSYLLNVNILNPLTPNGHYIGRTAPLTSRRCILNIYSTNIRTEYLKHAA